MIGEQIIEQVGQHRDSGIVFAAGGSADLILARNIAAELVGLGCWRVDLAQPLNCKALSEKGLLAAQGRFHALEPEEGLDPEAVLRHHGCIPSQRHPDGRRGKGLSISSSLEWDHGARYVCAAHGRGLDLLAGRRDLDGRGYDFAVGVDGGGDVLTHGDEEFDRVVVGGFLSGWSAARPLILVVMGLGADGASPPEAFGDATLEGWTALPTLEVDSDFGRGLQRDLDKLGLWNPAPSEWTPDDPYWGYGLKVHQIIVLAVRDEFPFGSAADDQDRVRFPRRRELKWMNRNLLREARFFLHEGE